MKLYVVFDEVAKEPATVFPALSDEAAERSFSMLLSTPSDNIFTRFPSQFSLFYIGDCSFRNERLVYFNDASDCFVQAQVIKKGLEYSQYELDAERHKAMLHLGYQPDSDKEVSEHE